MEVSGCSLLIPGGRDLRFRLIGVSRYSLRISGAGGSSFRVPTDRNDSRYEARRQGAIRCTVAFIGIRLYYVQFENRSRLPRARHKNHPSNLKRLPLAPRSALRCARVLPDIPMAVARPAEWPTRDKLVG